MHEPSFAILLEEKRRPAMAYKEPKRTDTEADPSVPPARYVAAALIVLGLALAIR